MLLCTCCVNEAKVLGLWVGWRLCVIIRIERVWMDVSGRVRVPNSVLLSWIFVVGCGGFVRVGVRVFG